MMPINASEDRGFVMRGQGTSEGVFVLLLTAFPSRLEAAEELRVKSPAIQNRDRWTC